MGGSLRSSEGWDEAVREYLRGRFGVEELPGRVVERARGLWLTTADLIPQGVKVHSVGVRLFYLQGWGLKPASLGLSFLAGRIKRNRVEVDLDELERLLLGHAVERPEAPEGYVAIVYRGDVIGCGKVREGKLFAEISKARRQELLAALTWERGRER